MVNLPALIVVPGTGSQPKELFAVDTENEEEEKRISHKKAHDRRVRGFSFAGATERSEVAKDTKIVNNCCWFEAY